MRALTLSSSARTFWIHLQGSRFCKVVGKSSHLASTHTLIFSLYLHKYFVKLCTCASHTRIFMHCCEHNQKICYDAPVFWFSDEWKRVVYRLLTKQAKPFNFFLHFKKIWNYIFLVCEICGFGFFSVKFSPSWALRAVSGVFIWGGLFIFYSIYPGRNRPRGNVFWGGHGLWNNSTLLTTWISVRMAWLRTLFRICGLHSETARNPLRLFIPRAQRSFQRSVWDANTGACKPYKVEILHIACNFPTIFLGKFAVLSLQASWNAQNRAPKGDWRSKQLGLPEDQHRWSW